MHARILRQLFGVKWVSALQSWHTFNYSVTPGKKNVQEQEAATEELERAIKGRNPEALLAALVQGWAQDREVVKFFFTVVCIDSSIFCLYDIKPFLHFLQQAFNSSHSHGGFL